MENIRRDHTASAEKENVWRLEYERSEMENGYFTVEAAMVLPLVISILYLTICLFIFQYDRCVMEIQANYLCVVASSATPMRELEQERYLALLYKRASDMPFFLWKQNELKLERKIDVVTVQSAGTFTLPSPGWNLISGVGGWNAEIKRRQVAVGPEQLVKVLQRLRKYKRE